jgi:hypothetical protein
VTRTSLALVLRAVLVGLAVGLVCLGTLWLVLFVAVR